MWRNMLKMDRRSDFIQWLGQDMSMIILDLLDDPADLVRVNAVSTSWRHFVITNKLFKHLCLKKFPEMSSVVHVIEVKRVLKLVDAEPNISTEWERLKRDQRVYAVLARGLSVTTKDCIDDAICASTTDNSPDESIFNTLEPSEAAEHSTSYWSSSGESDPTIPERLNYKLSAKLCVITEVHVQPFKAYFQFGLPIYSAKAVRFRMGHPRDSSLLDGEITYEDAAEEFIWTYISPEFPMAQNNSLQKFKLPEPVICIGGLLQVELLGRVQTQEMDDLYYICISNVQAIGRSLLPLFDVGIHTPSGNCTLKYHPEENNSLPTKESPEGETSGSSGFRNFTVTLMQRGAMHWEQMFFRTLLGTGAIVGDDTDDESDDDLLA